MSKFVSLHNHCDGSLLDGLTKPERLVEVAAEYGQTAIALTEHGSISTSIEFADEAKKKNIKPLLGCEFYLSKNDATVKEPENRRLDHLCVISKNLTGWRSLIQAVSASNRPEHFYYKPRLSLEQLAPFAGNLLGFSGHVGSQMASVLFTDDRAAYGAKTIDEVKKFIDPDWVKKASQLLYKHLDIFGKENFFLEIQLMDKERMPCQEIIAQGLRYLGKKEGVKCVGEGDSHYPKAEDAHDQRVILCIGMKTTLREVNRKLASDEDVGLAGFFKSSAYHIPTYDELLPMHTEEELANTCFVADMCEQFDILSPPKLPKFVCPNNLGELEYLKEICREGWNRNIKGRVSNIDTYKDRANYEFGVISEAGLAGYFLIVQDFIKYAKSNGQLLGVGRGSSGGSLIAYLAGITEIDPIPYNLLFERFYNSGRNTKDNVSLPDIDTDFPINYRENVMNYLREKYGNDCVGQIATYGTVKGRAAIKDVFKVHDACTFDEVNKITEFIPDESKISDKLQEMEELEGESSIVKWALENNSKQLREWCYIDDKGQLQGKYSKLFEQAIRLEGTKRSQGKHAAGVVISPEPLSSLAPMIYDKNSDNPIIGLDYNRAEKSGLVKMDILGTAVCDKLMYIQELVN